MPENDFLFVVAEIAVAFAGFAGLVTVPAATQDIPHSARRNCSAPKSCPPAQTPQAAIRFAFIRSWCALTRAAARSVTTAPTGVRRRCYTASVGGGGASWSRPGRGTPRLGTRLDRWP